MAGETEKYLVIPGRRLLSAALYGLSSINFILIHEIVSHLAQLTSIELTIFMFSADVILHRLFQAKGR